MNTLEQELTEYYLDAEHGNKIVLRDDRAPGGMVERGVMPHSVILGESPEAEELEPVISSLGLAVPVYRAPEEQVADFLSEQTGINIKPCPLRVFVEVPVLPLNEETLLRFRRVVILNHIIYPTNIAKVINLCCWFGVDALFMYEAAKSPFLPAVSLQTDFRNFEIPVVMLPDDPNEYIPLFRDCGYNVIGTALRADSLAPRDLRRFSGARTALLFGNEYFGLHDEDIEMCDHVVKIPMARGIDSLNIAEACGITLYELTAGGFAGKEIL